MLNKYYLLLFLCFGLSASKASYQVNFIWLNKETQPEMNYVFPEAYPNCNGSLKILPAIEQWLQTSPNASFILWYDSTTATLSQFEHTKSLFQQLSAQYHTSLVLKDIRSIAFVQRNPIAFQRDTRFLQWNAIDLTKLVVLYDGMQHSKDHYFIQTDFDIPAMSQEQLFDLATLNNLELTGFVIGRTERGVPENFFQIMNGKSPELRKALKKVINKYSLLAEYYLNNQEANSALRALNLGELAYSHRLRQPIRDSCVAVIFNFAYKNLMQLIASYKHPGRVECKNEATGAVIQTEKAQDCFENANALCVEHFMRPDCLFLTCNLVHNALFPEIPLTKQVFAPHVCGSYGKDG